jgi:hypothetical protein
MAAMNEAPILGKSPPKNEEEKENPLQVR